MVLLTHLPTRWREMGSRRRPFYRMGYPRWKSSTLVTQMWMKISLWFICNWASHNRFWPIWMMQLVGARGWGQPWNSGIFKFWFKLGIGVFMGGRGDAELTYLTKEGDDRLMSSTTPVSGYLQLWWVQSHPHFLPPADPITCSSTYVLPLGGPG